MAHHGYRGIAQLVEQRSPKPRAEGSSPSAPAKMKAHLLMCFLFYKKQKESKATVKKTVRWTVFRESVDASFLSYLCFISVVGTFAKLIVFCPCQTKHLKNGLGMRFLRCFYLIQPNLCKVPRIAVRLPSNTIKNYNNACNLLTLGFKLIYYIV